MVMDGTVVEVNGGRRVEKVGEERCLGFLHFSGRPRSEEAVALFHFIG